VSNEHRGKRLSWSRRLAILTGVVIATTAASASVAAAAPAPSPGVPLGQALPGVTQPKVDIQHDKCFGAKTASGATRTCLHLNKSGGSPLTAQGKALRNNALHGKVTSVQPQAAVPPAQCNFGTFGGGNQPDRFTSCSDNYWTLYTWLETNGTVELTGWLDFEDLQYITDDSSTPSWQHGLVLVVLDGWGDLEAGVPVAIASGCELNPNACEIGVRIPGGDAGGSAFDAVPYTSWSSEWDELDNGNVTTIANSVDYLDENLGVEISGEGPYNPWAFDDIWAGLVARCDNIVSGAACVNEDFVPTLTYDSTRNPLVAPVAQHIYDAQNGGLQTRWGVPPSTLYRDTNAADIAANNRVACSSVTLPPGTSCDEFPMASTYEGAAFQSDYSTAIVPVSANSSQGGLTNAFYGSNRILDGIDPFYVLAILTNGTPSW
jgi:hypothetical protein